MSRAAASLGPYTIANRIAEALEPLELLEWALHSRLECAGAGAGEIEVFAGPLVGARAQLEALVDALHALGPASSVGATDDKEPVAPANTTSDTEQTTSRLRYPEAKAIGDFDPNQEYRMYEATTDTMLASAVCPVNADELLPNGLQCLADDLSLLTIGMSSQEGRELNPDIFISVARGIETRLRILAEIARRTLGNERQVTR
jgi:hypothetical protein